MSSPNTPVALVTGAASGIGRAVAHTFAAQNTAVVLADIDAESGLALLNELQEAGHNAQFVQADVAQADEVEQMVKQAVAAYGRIDYAVNNAGIEGAPVRTADASEADFDRIMAVNVKGVWLCMKAEIRQMIAQGGGAIVNMASVAGLVGAHSLPIYSASKHAVVGLTKSAAVEYARKNIRVNAVCPAVIRTPMVDRAFAMLPQYERTIIAANPSRRLGEVQEVANAVAWLCSDAASFTNGAALTVDGGLTAQ